MADGPVTLGHRRLKIIDLSDEAGQPMTDGSGRCTLVYNGEIYNHIELREELAQTGWRFRTRSDTEVLLAAYAQWGPACLDRFNGMFAFAIWDRLQQELFCARDRLGVKPFYYRQNERRLVFASEIKALLAEDCGTIRVEATPAFDFLVHGLTEHRSETFFKGIKKLPAGHYMVAGAGGIRMHRYWKIPEPGPEDRDGTGLDEDIHQFRRLLTDSVRLRLRSDVPIGTCLSGGIDSSAIACLINQSISPEYKTNIGRIQKVFSAISTEPSLDERPFVRMVVAKTRAESYHVYPDPAGFLNDLDELLWHQEEPFTNSSIFAQWCVFKEFRNAGVTVALDGQGADEQLGGYRKFTFFLLKELFTRGRYGRFLRECLHLPQNMSYFAGIDLRHSFRYFTGPVLHASLSKLLLPEFRKHEDRTLQMGSGRSLARRMNLDMTRFSLPSLLRYEDKNAMAFSVESRTPYLDYRLVEFLARTPVRRKIYKGWTKFLLRSAMKGVIPGQIRLRKDKLAFDTPQDRWLRGPLTKEMVTAFDNRNGFLANCLQTGGLREEFFKFLKNRSWMSGNFFFRCFILQKWAERFHVAHL